MGHNTTRIFQHFSTPCNHSPWRRALACINMALLISFLGTGPVSAQNVTNTGSLYVTSGTLIFMGGDFTNNPTGATENHGSIELDGDWVNHGSFSDTMGTVSMTGANQLLTGSVSTTFNNLNALGTGIKTMTLNATVTDTLRLNDRELATDSNIMFITNVDTGAITRTTGFVSSLDTGRLSRATLSTNTYRFPVGSSIGTARYRPVEITPTSATAHTFTVRMGNVDPTVEGYNTANKQPGIGAVNPNWYHRINRTNGTSAADLTIFKDILELKTAMVHWEIDWESTGLVTVSPTSVTKLAWNDFSPDPFALAEEVLVVDAGNDTTICTGVDVQLQATVTSGIGPYSYDWTPGTFLNDSTIANPLATAVSAAITYTVSVYDSGTGSLSLPDTIIISTNPSYFSSSSVSICLGDSVQLPGGTYATTSGTFNDTLITLAGCDSIFSTTVTIDTAFVISAATSFCQGDSVQLPGGAYATTAGTFTDSLISVAGCDSIIVTTVTIDTVYAISAFTSFCQGDSVQLPGGSYASTAGTFNDTLTTVAGCDSVITTTVSVDSVYLIPASASICQGDSVQLPSGTYATAAGIFNDTLVTVAGCDSIIATTVSVDSVYLILAAASICQGDSIQLPGGAYATVAGTFNDTLATIAGCDSVIATTVSLNPTFLAVATVSICQGDSIQLPGGAYTTTAGIFNDTLATIAGCDSIISTTVSVDAAYLILGSASFCQGDSVQLPSGAYTTTAGTFTDSLTTIAGCDSIISTAVSLDSTYQLVATASFCQGDSLQLPGGAYTAVAGTFTDSLTTVAGCDSVIQTTVSIDSIFFDSVAVSICQGDSTQLPGGSYVTVAGTFNDTLTTGTGCDSVITTTVTIDTAYFSSFPTSICLGDSVQLPSGTYVSTAGTFNDSLTTITGCDSIISIIVSIDSSYLIPVSTSICQGDSIQLPGGAWVNTANIYVDTLSTITGCDSIIETTLSIQPAPNAAIAGDTSICIGASATLSASGGASYLWNTGAISSSITVSPLINTAYSVLVTNPGCSVTDSATVTVNVNNLPTIVAVPELVTIVFGESVLLSASGGVSYNWTPAPSLDDPSGSNPLASPIVTTLYFVSGTDVNGCSSIDSVLVTVSQDLAVGVPNIFSPNGDGQNDVLQISEQGLDWMRLVIYDRWGEKVFESSDINISWDGTFKGSPMNPAVFVYYLEGAFLNGDEISKQGNITLVR